MRDKGDMEAFCADAAARERDLRREVQGPCHCGVEAGCSITARTYTRFIVGRTREAGLRRAKQTIGDVERLNRLRIVFAARLVILAAGEVSGNVGEQGGQRRARVMIDALGFSKR
jgi:hypothetical protein